MVKKKEKEAAIDFICDRLEDSRQYNIQRKGEKSLLVAEKPEIRETPRNINVVVANFLKRINDFQIGFQRNWTRQVYTAPVFYKDGKSAFVRMVERNKSWRTDKSLKRYSPQQINQMLHLRGIEKAVTKYFGDKLTYYQPETARLDESLREFRLEDVWLDYSHLTSADEGHEFAKNRTSIDYKLPLEVEKIKTRAAKFAYRKNDNLFRARIVPARDLKKVKEDLMKDDAGELGLDFDEAYHLMHPED